MAGATTSIRSSFFLGSTNFTVWYLLFGVLFFFGLSGTVYEKVEKRLTRAVDCEIPCTKTLYNFVRSIRFQKKINKSLLFITIH